MSCTGVRRPSTGAAGGVRLMNTCIICGENLVLGFCVQGHSQTEEPDTIDEALDLKVKTLKDLTLEARAAGEILPIKSFGSD